METGWYESVSLSDYFGVIARRKWIVLLVTVLMTVSAVAYSKNQTPKYQATAELLSPIPVSSSSKSGITWSVQNAPLAKTLKIANLVLNGKPEPLPKLPPDVIVNSPDFPARPAGGLDGQQLYNATGVVPNATSDGIDFTVSASDPVLAERLATAWAVTYGNYVTYQNIRQTAEKFISIDTQLHPAFYTVGATNPKLCTAGTSAGCLTQAQIDTINSQEAGPRNALLTAPRPPDVQAASNANQTQPQTTRNTILGLVLGLILGVILAFIQDLLDKRIRTADEVGRRLRVPLLASIPSPPRSLRDHPLVLLAPRGGAQGPSAEAYRIAKLNLGTVMRANRAKAVMFVAAADSEGTSRTVANMAVALARSGSHVVLVDANMRRPAIDRFYGLDDRTGLSDILSGHGDLADALTIVDVGGEQPDDVGTNGRAATGGLLEVLPAGPTPADAADLLESRAMSELLGELRGRADVVLIDAPPMLPVTDAMMLGSKVDGVIVVARARLASRPHMVAMARALDACAAPTLGFLFTGVSVSEENEYGGYVGVGGAGLSHTRTPQRERELL
ncbi:MAG TPA: Wzz/FepE/Etk N-terminal domain-containing protein [Gaiellales bacterium]|nr:Wzz/FepE/Etk N-terminal domain-containing protein [Gaiellales bacterium]